MMTGLQKSQNTENQIAPSHLDSLQNVGANIDITGEHWIK